MMFTDIFQRPSTSVDPIVSRDHYDYKNAERLGEQGEPCAKIFKCKSSLLEIVSKVF